MQVMVWVYPHGGQSQLKVFEGLAAYLNSAPVKQKLGDSFGAPVDELIKLSDLEGYGKIGKKLSLHLPAMAPGSVQAEIFGAYADTEISIVYF